MLVFVVWVGDGVLWEVVSMVGLLGVLDCEMLVVVSGVVGLELLIGYCWVELLCDVILCLLVVDLVVLCGLSLVW